MTARKRRELRQEDEPEFAAFVKAAFAHRRKTLVNSLKNEGYDQIPVIEALQSFALSPTVRAEILSVERFIDLTRVLRRY